MPIRSAWKDSPKKNWANLTGYDPANDVFNLPLTYGRKLVPDDMDKIVVGSQFVQDLGFGSHPKDLLGKRVVLNFRTGPASAPDWGPLPTQPPLNADKSWYDAQSNASVDIPADIVGIINNGTLDNGQSYITIGWARRLMIRVSWQYQQQPGPGDSQNQNQKPNQPYNPPPPKLTLQKEDDFARTGYNTIILKVDDQANITPVAEAVKKLGFGANTAKAMLDQINRILTMVGIVLALIGGISLFVAAIGIINTMIMATFERVREIGVMRACGATRSTIRKLFTFEAGLLGFWGGVFGLLISLGLGQIARFIVNHFHASLGNIPIEKIGTFPWWLIVGVIVFTSLLGMAAGLYPAIRASRMNPVEALRYE
ncbi:MAG: ABC transporter permease [Candidatus Kerfeldbacteria bacterium]|nr:ABC transporter permease [Candidatus Kerfeldbacteria bacterium]